MGDYILALLLGSLLDLALGDPSWLYHPVCVIGKYISYQEKRLRARGGNLRRSALWLTASTVLLTMGVVALILALLAVMGRIPLFIGMTLLDWMGLAALSLAKEARGVSKALERGIEEGREQVARIVGRDTSELSRMEIIKATIETVAENTADGIISPMVYAALGGPVLLWGFKAASTLDSMVGYLDPKYKDIGWSSARLDDLLNYLPARLTALLLCAAAAICGLDGKNALRIVKRDHRNHKSPNCAWSEAAAAGALHIQLGGAHLYFGKMIDKPTIGEAQREVVSADIDHMVRMMFVASGLMLLLLVLLSLVF